MNFLAHIYLSFDQEELMIGNFLADFLTNKQVKELTGEMQRGVALHRLIDSYTDNHPSVLRSNLLFHQDHGKYAPVLTDVLYDYILGQEWSKYAKENLDLFIKRHTATLSKYQHVFPPRRNLGILKMIKGNFLKNYTTLDGLRFTFSKMDQRTRYPSDFVRCIDILQSHKAQLTEDFNLFFPDLIEEVQSFLAENSEL